MSVSRNFWKLLLASHVAAGLVGVGLGAAYERHRRPTTQAALRSLARLPVVDAGHLAFRFGSAQHAQSALESVTRLPAVTERDWSDRMTAELRLAGLDGEFRKGSKRSTHLDAARAACQRFKASGCTPEALRALTITVTHQRRF